MSSVASLKAQMQKLIDAANAKTGEADTTLTAAVYRLISGYATETICRHENTHEENHEDCGFNHSFDWYCTDCGALLGHEFGDHVDEDYDCKCDLCGSNMHNMVVEYTSTGSGSHYEIGVCSKCGATDGTAGAVKCEDKDGDGKCDKCGADVETVCEHLDVDFSYIDNGNGTHKKTATCILCGEFMYEKNEDCTDTDNNGKCDKCGGALETECAHRDTYAAGWTYQGDGTHVVGYKCRECGETVRMETEPCTDSNGDGRCDVCNGLLDTGIWEYKAGELTGLYEYLMQCSSKALICTKTTAYGGHTAVGAVNGDTASLVSGKQIRAIPVPKAASKMEFTAGDTNTRGVKAVFIKGKPDNVTEYSGLPNDAAVSVTNKVCSISFEKGKWDYVALNLTGSWSSSITAPQAGTKATLVFA